MRVRLLPSCPLGADHAVQGRAGMLSCSGRSGSGELTVVVRPRRGKIVDVGTASSLTAPRAPRLVLAMRCAREYQVDHRQLDRRPAQPSCRCRGGEVGANEDDEVRDQELRLGSGVRYPEAPAVAGGLL